MKKSTIIKYIGVAACAAVLAGVMTACGESRTPNAKTTLSAPKDLYLSFEREIATTNYVLTWESVENADEYEISVDGETVGKTWKTRFDLTDYVTVDEQATLGVTALGGEEFLSSNESVLQCTAEEVGWEVLYTATGEGYEAYLGLTQLSGRLVIPDTYKGKPVTGIKEFGFARQTALGTAGIARTVEITSVRLPRGLKEIGNNAFWGCSDLREIEFPEGLTKIGVGAFDSCNSLQSITLPASITEWSSAFMDCRDLEEVILPNGLTTIPMEAFWGCISLTEIEIPETVTVIDTLAFCGCASLSAVEIPNGVTVLNGFAECKSLKEITVPSSVVEMNLANCTGLKKVVFEKGSKIEILSFAGCSALEEIQLPSSLKEIGKSAFRGCTSLSSIEIPKGVTSITGGAFGGCTSLKEISLETGNGAYKTVNGDLYTIDGKTLVQYACGKEETEFTVPAGVETVGERAFYGSLLKKVVVPSWVKRIEDSAFYGSRLLEELSLSEGLEYIGESFTSGSATIAWLKIPGSVKTIVEYTFSKQNISYLELSEGVEAIENYAVGGLAIVENLIVPTSMKKFG
ncbi:MAG: leucine-rich repeat domain-containing protein, partial [Clostridia bacterium]|nr:leucine-rich repeat domain-containing protein [Clostridia bacterium]